MSNVFIDFLKEVQEEKVAKDMIGYYKNGMISYAGIDIALSDCIVANNLKLKDNDKLLILEDDQKFIVAAIVGESNNTLLWQGSTKGQFNTTFNLYDNLENYKFINVVVEVTPGIYEQKIIDTNANFNENVVIQRFAIGKSTDKNVYMYEYVITLNENTFMTAYSIKLDISDPINSRIDNFPDSGIIAIVGYR